MQDIIFHYVFFLSDTSRTRYQRVLQTDKQSFCPRSYEAPILRCLITRFLRQMRIRSFRRAFFFSWFYRQIFFLLRMICMRYNEGIHTKIFVLQIRADHTRSESEDIDFQDYILWFLRFDERQDLQFTPLVLEVVFLIFVSMLLRFHSYVPCWKNLSWWFVFVQKTSQYQRAGATAKKLWVQFSDIFWGIVPKSK